MARKGVSVSGSACTKTSFEPDRVFVGHFRVLPRQNYFLGREWFLPGRCRLSSEDSLHAVSDGHVPL